MHPLMMAVVSIGMSDAAQFSFKAGMSRVAVRCAMAQPMGFTSDWLCWDVSKAHPRVGPGFALKALIWFLIGEPLQRAAGAALICAGVWIIAQT